VILFHIERRSLRSRFSAVQGGVSKPSSCILKAVGKRKEGEASRQWMVDSRLLWGTSQRNKNKNSHPTPPTSKNSCHVQIIVECPNFRMPFVRKSPTKYYWRMCSTLPAIACGALPRGCISPVLNLKGVTQCC
jgi:hypothetical protein